MADTAHPDSLPAADTPSAGPADNILPVAHKSLVVSRRVLAGPLDSLGGRARDSAADKGKRVVGEGKRRSSRSRSRLGGRRGMLLEAGRESGRRWRWVEAFGYCRMGDRRRGRRICLSFWREALRVGLRCDEGLRFGVKSCRV